MKQLQNKMLIVFLITSIQFLDAAHGRSESTSKPVERTPVAESPLYTETNPTKINAIKTEQAKIEQQNEIARQQNDIARAKIIKQKTQGETISNEQLSPNQPFDPNYQNEFMPVRAEFYLKALKQKFPNASEADLENYTTIFLNENFGKYNQKIVPGFFWNSSVDDPIKVRPSDITNNPTYPQSKLGKLFSSIAEQENLKEQSLQITPNEGLDFTGIPSQAKVMPNDATKNMIAKSDAPIKQWNTEYSKAINAHLKADYATQGELVNNILETLGTVDTSGNLHSLKNSSADTETIVEQLMKEYENDENVIFVLDRVKENINNFITLEQQKANSIETAIQNTINSLETISTPAEIQNLVTNLKNKMIESKTVDSADSQKINSIVDAAVQQILALKQSGNPVTDADYTNIINQMTKNILKITDLTMLEVLFNISNTVYGNALTAGNDLIVKAKTTAIEGASSAASAIGSSATHAAAEPIIKDFENRVDAIEKGLNDLRATRAAETQNQYTLKPIPNRKNTTDLAISNATSYFTDTFKAAAKLVRGTPEALKNLISKITATVSWVLGLSQTDAAKLEAESIKAADVIITDKNSWFNTTNDKDFDAKFDTWSSENTANLYKQAGKGNPADIRIIQLESKNTDPLTPKITLNYNPKTKVLKSVLIDYNGNSYSVQSDDGQAFSRNDKTGEFIIPDISLDYKQNISIAGKTYNFLMENVLIDPFLATDAGNLVGSAIHQQVKDFSLIKSKLKEGKLTITYNPDNGSIVTQAVKNIDNSEVTTTKEYSTKSTSELKETIAIKEPKGDIFAPAITIDNTGGVLSSVSIKHGTLEDFNSTKNDIQFDPTTGIYSIDAPLEQRIKPEPKLIPGLSKEQSDRVYALQSRMAAIAYESGIENLENIYAIGTLKSYSPIIYNAIKNILLEPIPVEIVGERIEYNPKTNSITTTVTTRLSNKETAVKTRSYTI